jgi:hypothetical protein
MFETFCEGYRINKQLLDLVKIYVTCVGSGLEEINGVSLEDIGQNISYQTSLWTDFVNHHKIMAKIVERLTW